MQVSTTTSTALQSNTQTSQTKNTSAASLDYTAFLRLLIAQMQNQDPTNPTDPAQWMGQIASFSNVEQSIQANAKLDALMTSTALSQVDGLIGHTITSGDGTISGKRQDPGTYVWMAKGTDYTGKVVMRKGTAVLLR